MHLVATATIAAAVLLVVPATAPAQSDPPTGLEDLLSARAGQAEGEIVRRGFRSTGGSKGDDRSYANWWNAEMRRCVVVGTAEGRYVSVQATTPADCGQSASSRPRPDGGYRPTQHPRHNYSGDPGYGRPPFRPGNTHPSTLPATGGRPVVDGEAVDLGLVCFGDGAKDGLASGTRWTWNEDRDRYEKGSYTESRPETFEASLMVQVWGDGGRIRLPRSLIPPLNSRGDNGWWNMTDVVVGPDTIRGTYRLNGLNRPKVVIDRRSGRITVQGFGSYGFQGRCDLIGHEERRF